jgi:hypothetical protein
MPERSSHPDTSFSNAYGAVSGAGTEWFDPRLHVDTDLFVDPFLMFDDTSAPWSSAEHRIVEFFNQALLFVAESGGDATSRAWQRAAAMLSFPEPAQFCLGYSKTTIFGGGSARVLGEAMLASCQLAINAGITEIEQFGDVLIFGENFGADRVSDMVCNILMDMFVEYTQEVASAESIPVERFTLTHCGYDFSRLKWRQSSVLLPLNLCWDRPRTPVVLAPARFLDGLPCLQPGAFWDWVYDNRNEQLRTELGYTVFDKVNKTEILNAARRRPRIARRMGREYVREAKAHPPKPYDTVNDPELKTVPFDVRTEYLRDLAVQAPTKAADVCGFIGQLVDHFKQVVEHRVTSSFWDGDKPRPEGHAQTIFYATAVGISELFDVDLSPETNAGSGPVDFKFSHGWTDRAHVELKLARSTSLMRNVRHQLPTYLKTEEISCGYFVVIQYSDRECDPDFMAKVRAAAAEGMREHGVTFSIVFVDARKKPSASKVTTAP